MAIAALSTAGFSQYVASSSNVSASQQAWQSLEKSLASGNLAAAQTAFNTYSQLNQNQSTASGSGSSSASNSNSQVATDMKALGSAIGSGDVSAAQAAFATVANDLQSTPSQAVTNAESAVNQTVQWMDDLLNLSGSNNTDAAPVDPTTAMLNAAYGQNSNSNTTDPTMVMLDSAYGDSSTGSTSTSAGTGASATSGADAASATAPAAGSADATSQAVPSPLANGNAGSAASVNVYA
jgi:ribosomal protein S20